MERLHKLRDQQSESQHQHQHNAQQRDEKAEKVDGFIRRLLSGPAEQMVQPLFQPSHGHIDEKRQNAACQNGQDQIHKLCSKGQNGGKPQQRSKKRYAHNSYEQILFGLWFHDEVPFPEPVAEICKETVCGFFFRIVTRRKGLVKTPGKGEGFYSGSGCKSGFPCRHPCHPCFRPAEPL